VITSDAVLTAFPELRSQIVRAATSVTANIAEGKGRMDLRQYLQFLKIARGSLLETIAFLQMLQVSTQCIDEGKRLSVILTSYIGALSKVWMDRYGLSLGDIIPAEKE
jgi:four helix bundle protein